MLRTLTSRDLFSVVAIVVLAALGTVLVSRTLPMVQAGENWLADFRFGTLTPPRPQDKDVVVVVITEDTLATLPYRSPVDRGFLAGLLGHLEAAKPKAIGVDILFDQPTEAAKDEALQKKLRNLSVPVVVAEAATDSNLTKPQQAFLKRFTDGLATGLVNLVKDRADGTVRWILAGKTVAGVWRPGFVGRVAEAAGVAVPKRNVALVYRGAAEAGKPAFPIYQAHTVPVLPKKWFEGKLVLIGADLPLIDRHRTPFAAARGVSKGELPGVIIFAHALSQLIEGRTPPGLGAGGRVALIALFAGLGMLFAMFDLPVAAKSLSNLGVLAMLWVLGFFVYRHGGVMIPLLAPSMAFAVSSGTGVAFLGRRDRKQKKFIRDAFSHYVSPTIVDRLVDDPEQMNVGGERRELTYLFTDLAHFTSLTERTEPAVLVPLLNDYLSGMCRLLFEHGATIDKIVGDAVVGFFNAPVDQADHKARAVAAALDLDAFAQDFVAEYAEKGMTVGITRIGVHSGTAVIGNFGGDQFFDYTAHGDMVNTAARLESVNKHLGTRVCISGVTAEGCPEQAFRPVGALVLKGKSKGLEAFEPLVDGMADSPAARTYEKAFAMMRKNAPGAADGFRDVLALDPGDALAKFHLQRLESGEIGATIVMEEK